MFIDGQKAGDARNDGRGGETTLRIYDIHVRNAFEAWANSQPAHRYASGLTVPMNDRLVIDLLVEEAELGREYRRMCRNKTVFRFKGAPADEWREIAVPFTPVIKATVLAKYGDIVEEFLNDRIEGSGRG